MTTGALRRAEPVDAWLTKWASVAVRDKCLRAVRQAERRETHGRLPRKDVPAKALAKLGDLAANARYRSKWLWKAR